MKMKNLYIWLKILNKIYQIAQTIVKKLNKNKFFVKKIEITSLIKDKWIIINIFHQF